MYCQNNYQKSIDENAITIVDKKILNDAENSQIDITLFIKNNSQTDIAGIITFELEFRRSNKNKLNVFRSFKRDMEEKYKEGKDRYGEVPDEINKAMEDLQSKYDSLKTVLESADSSKIFTLNVDHEIEINPGGLAKVNFIKDMPPKYVGYNEASFLDDIKIKQITKQKK